MASNNIRIRWNGRQALATLRAATRAGVADALEHLLTETNKIAPFDEGTLTRSGDTDIEDGVKGVKGSVFYDAPYAARLHEHPEYNFQNGREGKYLEKTALREASTVREYIRRSIGGVL